MGELLSNPGAQSPAYFIWTIGCQMNKADSERIRVLMDGWGLRPAADVESADAVILNSCVVRQKAENRVLSKIGSLAALKRRKPDISVIVTGCLVDGQGRQLRREYPHVDAFFRPGEFDDLAAWLLSRGLGGGSETAPPGPQAGTPVPPPPLTAFVPIIQGCDNFCSYCIVPYRRGRERSRPLADIVCEVQQMAHRGVREITLVGQNVDSYGHDLPDRPDLADLLRQLNGIGELCRLRFLTSHPKDMTLKLIHLLPSLEKVCEHINLPVQSGSDEILRAMRRGYAAGQYRDLIGEIRRAVPGVALSTDVIVGFPGETELQFRETYDLLGDLRFDTVHVAAYSPRPGTAAARTLKDDITREVKKHRLLAIEQLQEQIAREVNSGLVGEAVEVLVEKRAGDKWTGRTRTNKLVFVKRGSRGDLDDLTGKLVMARITRASPWSLIAELPPGEQHAAG